MQIRPLLKFIIFDFILTFLIFTVPKNIANPEKKVSLKLTGLSLNLK